MAVGTKKGRKMAETDTSNEFRDQLRTLLSELEGSECLRVADAVIFSAEGFELFLDEYRRHVTELAVDTLKVWCSSQTAPDAEPRSSLLTSLLEKAQAGAQPRLALEEWLFAYAQATHLAARKSLVRAEATLARLRIDKELDAAAADLLKRAEAVPEEEAADLRADAADLLDPEFREAVLRSELALRDLEAARARGDVVSQEELEAELERDDVRD